MVLWIVLIFFTVAIAAVQSEPCQEGNHSFELVDTDYSGYGGQRRFNVNSCVYVPYAHQHYYITYGVTYTYVCSMCGYRKSVSVVRDDLELGEFCALHDVGK